eukprot:CAMPEP_0202968960 /NCGR_PEP_ID=MMETSP1396-20130829/14505_1 /ASSEMBLY_ACC=CAM_ASM_000872 /TAXON_ID= /ORGANISM="Pseudokeronopsis sp., Strain Brazil" /LENGTH=171 /DNA_ID=CAMNT_0049695937 /DNA_START=230 /DNA_END=745 /DNA_ORIENTATION=+
MPRNCISKVLDLERPFDSGGEESAEGCDEGGKAGDDEGVQLDGSQVDVRVPHELQWKFISDLYEDVCRHALELLEHGEGQLLLRTGEELGRGEVVSQHKYYHEGAEHAADEALPGLLRRQLYQGSASQEITKQIRTYVIGDNSEVRECEPEESLVEVVGDKGRGYEYDEQC